MISTSKADTLWRLLSTAIDSALAIGTKTSATIQHVQLFFEQLIQAQQSQRGRPVQLFMRESLFVHQGIP
ncbi:MAG: hypothetical protein AAGG01_17710, partial [Planctomycetota bacterium]